MSFHTVSFYPAVMGYLASESEWLKLPAYLHDVLMLKCSGRGDEIASGVCPIPMKVMVI